MDAQLPACLPMLAMRSDPSNPRGELSIGNRWPLVSLGGKRVEEEENYY